MPEVSLKPIQKKLERIFDEFNKMFYHNYLERPVITISPVDRGAYGWCTAVKMWTDKDGNRYYEISMSANYLNRSLYEVAGTLLHEMAHLYANQKGIQDCSRGNTYHNKRYKEIAENHGLLVGCDPKYGWTITSLNQRAIDIVDSMKGLNFNLSREEKRFLKITAGGGQPTGSISGGTASKGNSHKYICPCCGMSLRATKKVNIVCGDCQATMICSDFEN